MRPGESLRPALNSAKPRNTVVLAIPVARTTRANPSRCNAGASLTAHRRRWRQRQVLAANSVQRRPIHHRIKINNGIGYLFTVPKLADDHTGIPFFPVNQSGQFITDLIAMFNEEYIQVSQSREPMGCIACTR